MDYDRIEQAIQTRQEMMDKHGWIVDCVFDSVDSKCQTGTGADIHTHGLVENMNHKDLQIVLPIQAEKAHGVLCTIVKLIKEGKKFEAGKCYSGILQNNLKVRFVEATEHDRTVLRVILPDQNGKLHHNTLETPFKVQYNGLRRNK